LSLNLPEGKEKSYRIRTGWRRGHRGRRSQSRHVKNTGFRGRHGTSSPYEEYDNYGGGHKYLYL
jgi:hypothetical protein